MSYNPQFEQIGAAFTEHYYNTFDGNTDPQARSLALGGLYDAENSYLTFEGAQMKGKEAILQKLAALSFRKIQRRVTKTDCHPTADGGVLVTVFGQLQTDEDPVQSFMHTFVLRPAASSFFIANEIFRLVIHDLPA